jgi:hypothetical protein
MDAPISPKGISKDAQRHVGDYVHHVEKAKEMRLERQDGTGRAHEFKKNGAGKGNWGSLNDDVMCAWLLVVVFWYQATVGLRSLRCCRRRAERCLCCHPAMRCIRNPRPVSLLTRPDPA